ncbi:hypothetical protein psyc5s11_04240 [Clostridium gelidum]|uniref:Normocyte-binding protein n=1 Tax=Clostridium gelidum TaxID=704125 RepID=A0ABN6IVI1_9CLOT|nr:normocyte-binding protein [Clostridium gelidum]BCZ44357.1 hypothetical protein psyc5s11_04240 [Clostridium gelidum]
MTLQEIDLRNVYRRWKSDLGPFQGFFRSTPFVSLQTYDDFTLETKNINGYDQKVVDIIMENINENNFLIIDLPLDEILNLALVLNNEYSIKPILNVNLLFHPFGIIGNKDNINKLINNGLELKKINSKKFVMLIPYDRYNDKLWTNDLKDKLNNQYGIGEDDIPGINVLKELEYSKVIILTKDNIKEDLNDYVNFINKDMRVQIIKVM